MQVVIFWINQLCDRIKQNFLIVMKNYFGGLNWVLIRVKKSKLETKPTR